MKRIEDAASQLQRNVEQHCSIKENKGIAIKGAFRMFAHFLAHQRNKCSAQELILYVHFFARSCSRTFLWLAKPRYFFLSGHMLNLIKTGTWHARPTFIIVRRPIVVILEHITAILHCSPLYHSVPIIHPDCVITPISGFPAFRPNK